MFILVLGSVCNVYVMDLNVDLELGVVVCIVNTQLKLLSLPSLLSRLLSLLTKDVYGKSMDLG